MGKRSSVAWIDVRLYEDPEEDRYTVEVSTWRRGQSKQLSCFLDAPGGHAVPSEVAALKDYLESLVDWLTEDALELDRARML